jgi:uncharacterized membrane protein YsdA (DUF1294 family)
MKFPFRNLRPRAQAAGAPQHDRSVAAAMLLLFALVFGPVVGLHVAMAVFGSDTASAQLHSVHGKPPRG